MRARLLRLSLLVFATIATAAIGCGRFSYDELRDTTSDGSPADGATGSLSVVRQPGGWGPLDLTSEGTLDWIHLGLADIDDINRKDRATPLISDPLRVGGGLLRQAEKNDTDMDLSWSDGSPTATAGPIATTIYVDTANDNGDGFELTVEAAASVRTLRIFTGVWCARLLVRAVLDDGSAPAVEDTSFDFPDSAYDLSAYQVQFSAPTETRLRVSLLMDHNYCPTGDIGEVWLAAATLAE